MVREFTLVDGSGEEYSLTNEEHLLYNPSGLGYEHENTYRQIGNRFILANSVPKQSVISGVVHFSAPDAYYDYQEFIEFCGRDNLKMEYRLSEMPSRRVKRLTGTVDWNDISNGNYAGTYNFINGDYKFIKKVIEFDSNTIVNIEQEFADGVAVLYSITISEVRNTSERTYCSGIPSTDINLDNDTLDLYYANATYLGGSDTKIYFSLHKDSLQGKTISQWLSDNSAKFSYTLKTQVEGTNTDYLFNPRLMYNPMVEFYGFDEGSHETEITNGSVTYENEYGETISIDGSTIILENAVTGEELISNIVETSFNNENENSRFVFVGTDLCTDTNRSNLSIKDTGLHAVTYNSYVYTGTRILADYISSGTYLVSGTMNCNVILHYKGYTTTRAEGKITMTLSIIGAVPDSEDSYISHTLNNFTRDSRSFVFPNGAPSTDQTISFSILQAPFSARVTNLTDIYNTVKLGISVYAVWSGTGSVGITYKAFQDLSISDFHITNVDIDYGNKNISDIGIKYNLFNSRISQADSQHYQRAVRLNKVEKTELTKFSSLETKVEFECLEPWGDPFTSFVEHGTSPDPVNSITFDTDCHALSPCDLYISGPCTNPTWTHTVNGVEVTTGGYTGTIAAGEQLLIRAKDGACGIYLINGSGNTDDVYKYSDFSKDRFVFIRYGENVITVTDGTDPTTQIDCYIEGELYYESV